MARWRTAAQRREVGQDQDDDADGDPRQPRDEREGAEDRDQRGEADAGPTLSARSGPEGFGLAAQCLALVGLIEWVGGLLACVGGS
jgi:hypothetical protein